MAIQTATACITYAATANESFAITTQTAQTAKRDTLTFSNGNGSLQVTGVVDHVVTIAANSTVTALSTLTDTLDSAFAYTNVKAVRIAAPGTNNSTVTVSANITGFPSAQLKANSVLAYATTDAAGFAVTGANTITANGTDNDTLTVTLFLS
jgi:hypothetical protein